MKVEKKCLIFDCPDDHATPGCTFPWVNPYKHRTTDLSAVEFIIPRNEQTGNRGSNIDKKIFLPNARGIMLALEWFETELSPYDNELCGNRLGICKLKLHVELFLTNIKPFHIQAYPIAYYMQMQIYSLQAVAVHIQTP